MLPSLRGASAPLPPLAPLADLHAPPTPSIRYRDEAIRNAFAAFDTAGPLTAPVAAESSDSGVRVEAIDDYLKCILGWEHEVVNIGPRAAQHIAGFDSTESNTPRAPSLSCLIALAAFYMGLCQGRAFTADGEFDTAGLIDFVAARLGISRETLDAGFGSSPFANFVFTALKRNLQACQLSIYDADGQDLAAPSASLRFDGLPYGAICKGYMRKVTIRAQTLRAVDMSEVDLSDAYIQQCTFEGVLFSNANLKNVLLDTIVLMQCSFVDVDLMYVTCRDAVLHHVEFQKCQMMGVSFHATTLEATRFEQCNLREGVFDNDSRFAVAPQVSIDKSEFQACDLSNARLDHLRWCEGGFIDCILWKATMSDCLFKRATWRHPPAIVTKPPFAGAQIRDVQFHDCALMRLNADESQWTNCAFKTGNLTEASWRNSAVFGLSFAAVEMPRVRFDNALCRDLRFEAMCDLEGARFANATMKDIHFNGVQGRSMLRLNCTDFSSVALSDVRFVKCQMVSAKFPFAQLINVSFMRCSLNYADFDNSKGADLLGMLMSNRMKHYSTDGMIIQGSDIGSLSSMTRRVTLLNHLASEHCLLSNVLSGASGPMKANLVLHIADRLLIEAHDPVDSDTWMMAALLQAHLAIPFDALSRAQIDVHLYRILQRHAAELNRLEWRTRPENQWALEAVEHLRRLNYRQRQNAALL